MYGGLEHFKGILPHEKFPKHGAVERGKCAVLVDWKYVFFLTDILEKRTLWSPLCHLSALLRKFL